jgi:hypothetical protein
MNKMMMAVMTMAALVAAPAQAEDFPYYTLYGIEAVNCVVEVNDAGKASGLSVEKLTKQFCGHLKNKHVPVVPTKLELSRPTVFMSIQLLKMDGSPTYVWAVRTSMMQQALTDRRHPTSDEYQNVYAETGYTANYGYAGTKVIASQIREVITMHANDFIADWTNARMKEAEARAEAAEGANEGEIAPAVAGDTDA